MNKLTREQAAVIGAFTGVICGPLPDLIGYVERKLGRPVQTKEMIETKDEVKLKSRKDFRTLCASERDDYSEPKPAQDVEIERLTNLLRKAKYGIAEALKALPEGSESYNYVKMIDEQMAEIEGG